MSDKPGEEPLGWYVIGPMVEVCITCAETPDEVREALEEGEGDFSCWVASVVPVYLPGLDCELCGETRG